MYTSYFSEQRFAVLVIVCSVVLSSCASVQELDPSPQPGGPISIVQPFFQDASFCSLNDEAGQVPGEARKHCCERKIQTVTDSSYLFNLSKANDAIGITAEVAGLLRAELGLSASAKIVFRMKEVKRWFATHCRKPGHCERHIPDDKTTCDSLYNQEVRQFQGFAGASESVNFITQAAVKAFLELYTVGITFTTTDSSMQFNAGSFYMRTIRKHQPCSGFQTETLNPEFWTPVNVATDSCQ